MGVEQYYQQSRDYRFKKSNITDKGVCLALSALWLIKKSQLGIDSLAFWDWLGVAPNAIDQSQKLTKKAENFLNENNDVFRLMKSQDNAISMSKSAKKGLMSDYVIPLVKGTITKSSALAEYGGDIVLSNPKPDFIRAKMTRYYDGPGGETFYQYISMQGPDWGHAMACVYEAGGRIYFLDPNAGEVSFNSAYDGFSAPGGLVEKILNQYKNVTEAAMFVFK